MMASISRPAQAEFFGSTWAGVTDELVNRGIGGENAGWNKDRSKSDSHLILSLDGTYVVPI